MTSIQAFHGAVDQLLQTETLNDIAHQEAARQNLNDEIEMCLQRVCFVPLEAWAHEGNLMTMEQALDHIRATQKWVRSEGFREWAVTGKWPT